LDFRIADTFTGSMAGLTNDEQKLVKTTAFDLQLNPAGPGMQLHKLDRAKDRNFWSVRVGRDIRLIVHKTAASLLLCYVGHHDDAYGWAERRKIERHPATGAAQLVEIRERVQEIVVPNYTQPAAPAAKPRLLFSNVTDEQLLGYGVPAEWIGDVRAATEDTIFDVAEHLPREAAAALLDLATGHTPAVPEPAAPSVDPFEHPAAQQRFRLMTDVAELAQALEAPWETWSIFLHPDQKNLVERQFNGPARVAGSAGTGKTVVALHRAAYLARKHPQSKVLLTTFSELLAVHLQARLATLLRGYPEVAQRITVRSIDAIGLELYGKERGTPTIAGEQEICALLRDASSATGQDRFSEAFLWSEWNEVVDAWQLRTAEAYRGVARLGRKTRLSEKQRNALWRIFEQVESALTNAGKVTMPQVFAVVTEALDSSSARPFDFVVVDEAQDVSVGQLRFFATFAGGKANAIVFTGDLGQRIFQSPFSWKSLGIDVRGRSHTLRINYRTSQQIRQKPIGCCQDGDRRRWNRLRPRSHPVGVQRSASSSHDRQNSGSRDSSGRRLDSDVQIVGDWTR
jgi:mRNA-degrading endonuclease RelE of RelBE toxin-antitoxin system